MSIKINSIDKEFVYIDPSLRSESGTEGDGSTPQNALWDFPSTVSENSLYLIRKTSRHVVAKLKEKITDSTCTSLTIWGMPGPTEKHWNDVPEVARTAWGGDTQEGYKAALLVPGYVNSSNTIKFDLSALRYLNLSNLRFLDSMADTVGGGTNSCIYSSSNACDMVIEDVNFAGVIETTTDSETQYLQYHESTNSHALYTGKKWIYANDAYFSDTTQVTANSCIINNCTFDFVTGGEGIHIGYCRNTCITNVTVNLYAIGRQSGSTCFVVSGRQDDYQKNHRVVVRGLTGKLYCNAKSSSTSHYFDSLLNISNSIVDIKDVDISFANPQYGQLSTSTNQTISFSGLVTANRIFAGSRVASFTADFANYSDLAATSVLKIDYYKQADSPRNGQHLVVKDVTITSNGSPTVTTLGDHKPSLETEGLPYNSNTEPFAALSVLLTNNAGTNTSDDVLLQNVNINAYKGVALVATGCMLDLSESDIKGLVKLKQCTGKIKSISTFAVQKALSDDGGNLVHVGEISCNKDSASYSGQPAVSAYNGTGKVANSSYILVTTSNTNCYSTDAYNEKYACCFICTNNSASGNYTCRNKTTMCQTWSSFRTGAQHKCSLKLENKNYNHAELPLIIGEAPFKGIVKHVDQGAHKIKLYANTTGYSSITATKFGQHLSVIARLPNGEMLSDVQGSWSADTTSEWNNLDGGTPFVLEIPITVTDVAGVDLEFQYTFNWYHTQGATYLDPYPVIE